METTLKNRALLGYIIAIASLVAVILLKEIAPFSDRTPLLFLLPVIAASAVVGGRGPGVFATIISSAAANFFFLGADRGFSVNLSNLYLTGIYAAEGIIVVFIVESVRASRGEVWKEREWFLTTLKSIDDAVIATDTEGCITFINPSALKLTEWSLEEVLKKN